MMSMCYWMNEGVGIKSSLLYPHLDDHKCFIAVSEQLPEENIQEDMFDIDSYTNGDPFFMNLGDFLCHLDDTNTMNYGDDGYGESYFLYSPSYPWNRRKNEPKSLSEVHRRIIDVVSKVTNLTKKQIDNLIDDDIYEYGCG